MTEPLAFRDFRLSQPTVMRHDRMKGLREPNTYVRLSIQKIRFIWSSTPDFEVKRYILQFSMYTSTKVLHLGHFQYAAVAAGDHLESILSNCTCAKQLSSAFFQAVLTLNGVLLKKLNNMVPVDMKKEGNKMPHCTSKITHFFGGSSKVFFQQPM